MGYSGLGGRGLSNHLARVLSGEAINIAVSAEAMNLSPTRMGCKESVED